MPTQKEREKTQKTLEQIRNTKKFSSNEVNEIVKKEINKVAENYQKIITGIRAEVVNITVDKATVVNLEKRLVDAIAQRDFIWEQYNSLVHSLGEQAIAVIYENKKEEVKS